MLMVADRVEEETREKRLAMWEMKRGRAGQIRKVRILKEEEIGSMTTTPMGLKKSNLVFVTCSFFPGGVVTR